MLAHVEGRTASRQNDPHVLSSLVLCTLLCAYFVYLKHYMLFAPVAVLRDLHTTAVASTPVCKFCVKTTCVLHARLHYDTQVVSRSFKLALADTHALTLMCKSPNGAQRLLRLHHCYKACIGSTAQMPCPLILSSQACCTSGFASVLSHNCCAAA